MQHAYFYNRLRTPHTVFLSQTWQTLCGSQRTSSVRRCQRVSLIPKLVVGLIYFTVHLVQKCPERGKMHCPGCNSEILIHSQVHQVWIPIPKYQSRAHFTPFTYQIAEVALWCKIHIFCPRKEVCWLCNTFTEERSFVCLLLSSAASGLTADGGRSARAGTQAGTDSSLNTLFPPKWWVQRQRIYQSEGFSACSSTLLSQFKPPSEVATL